MQNTEKKNEIIKKKRKEEFHVFLSSYKRGISLKKHDKRGK